MICVGCSGCAGANFPTRNRAGLEAGEEPFSGANRNVANSSENCSSIVPDPSTPSLGGSGDGEAARNGAAEGGPSGGGSTSLSAELQAFGSLLVAKLQAIVGCVELSLLVRPSRAPCWVALLVARLHDAQKVVRSSPGMEAVYLGR